MNSSNFNNGLINRHVDLIVLKKGTGVIPVEEANYFHNGKIKGTTKTIEQIIKDYKRFGKPFLEKQAKQFKNSALLKVGFEFIDNLTLERSTLNQELESNLKSGGHLISSLKSDPYLKLKTELQNVKGTDREIRKRIPELAYELLEFYCEK